MFGWYISCNILSTNISNYFHHYKFIPSNLFHIYLLEAWWYPQWTRNCSWGGLPERQVSIKEYNGVWSVTWWNHAMLRWGESTKFAFGCWRNMSVVFLSEIHQICVLVPPDHKKLVLSLVPHRFSSWISSHISS